MLRKYLILFSIFLLSLSVAFSQGRGGRQGQGQAQGKSPGPGFGQGQGQGQTGAQAGNTQREQKRIHATKQQRDQIRTCDRAADSIRKQARSMAKNTGKKYSAAEANQQRNQIRDQIRTMDQEHERLMNGLDATQQQAWQGQIREMNQLRQQLNLRQQQMDTELGSPNPDANRVAEHAREIEQTMNSLRAQYHALASEAGS